MQARILVVEDDQLQQSLLKSALEGCGYEVETASDGLSAVWRIREGHYDLVLLDYNLPEMDGMAVARLINDLMGQVARPRLVALTAIPGCVLGRELLTGKVFDSVVAKSVDLPALLATITRHVRTAPSRAVRAAAEFGLLVQEWGEYENASPRPPLAQDDEVQPRVLVVEDDVLQSSIVQAALQSQGYAVDTALDGLDAVRRMRNHAYDLALIDYELPEIDGFATARLISDLVSERTRPRLVALTSMPEHLTNRTTQWHRVFDEVMGKAEGLPAILAAVNRHLRSAPDAAVRRTAERMLHAA